MKMSTICNSRETNYRLCTEACKFIDERENPDEVVGGDIYWCSYWNIENPCS